LFQLPRDRSARTRQLPHPRTCGPVTRGAKNTRQDRREPSPSTHPCSPRPRKLRQGTAARETGRQGKASGGETNALVPDRGHGPDTSPPLLPRPPPRQGRDRGWESGRLTTRSHEKQSHVVVAATRPRSLLEKWTKSTEERGRRGRHEAGVQVPGGRFGGQDQKGSLTRRSFLCSDSALPPPMPVRRFPPPRCRSIGAFGELPLQSIY